MTDLQEAKDSSSPEGDLISLIEDYPELDPDNYEYNDSGDPFRYPWEGPHLDGCACPTCRLKRVKRREISDLYTTGGIL